MQTIKRLTQVCEITGLSKTTIYRMIQAGAFPQSVKLGARSVGWYQSDIQEWIDSRTHSMTGFNHE